MFIPSNTYVYTKQHTNITLSAIPHNITRKIHGVTPTSPGSFFTFDRPYRRVQSGHSSHLSFRTTCALLSTRRVGKHRHALVSVDVVSLSQNARSVFTNKNDHSNTGESTICNRNRTLPFPNMDFRVARKTNRMLDGGYVFLRLGVDHSRHAVDTPPRFARVLIGLVL